MCFWSISHTYIHKRARAREQNNKIYTCSLREKQVFCRFFCIYEKKVVILQRNCGISTSVVHRLPKPRRRVRFPYAALRRNALVA